MISGQKRKKNIITNPKTNLVLFSVSANACYIILGKRGYIEHPTEQESIVLNATKSNLV